ncbi:MAG: hypothetical protein ACPG7F_09625 [Aggregatilineales bacterium]
MAKKYIKLEHDEERHAAIKRLAESVPEARSANGRVKLSYFINWLIDRYASEQCVDITEARQPGGYHLESYQREIERLKQELSEQSSE